MSKSTTIVTAADVREFFRADAKRLNALSPEAQATVKAGARGRLHPEAVKVHNSRRRTRQYALGASGEAVAKRAAERKALAEAGIPVGKRGPLNAAAKEALSKGIAK